MTPTSTKPMCATGKFYVSSGNIIGPDGSIWIGKGLNIADWAAVGGGSDTGSNSTPPLNPDGSLNSASVGEYIFNLFPKVNFIRLNCQYSLARDSNAGNYNDSPQSIATFVANMNAKKVVVLVEDHLGSNSVPSGSAYNNCLLWYQNQAAFFGNNPYVWYGTTNEPNGNPNTVCQQELDIYNVVRKHTDAPVLLQVGNPPNPIWSSSTASYFKLMYNVIWDTHIYDLPYVGTGSASQTACNSALAAQVARLRGSIGITSADGIIPVVVGEYGTSISGNSVDPNGTETVIAVQTVAAISGSAAWTWSAGASDRLQSSGKLTSFGKELNQFLDGDPPSSWNDLDDT